MPEHLDRLGASAFSGCVSLMEINIPEGITDLYSFTFRGCLNLQKVTLPDSLKSIAETAFMDCVSLQNVSGYLDERWETWEDHPSVTDYSSDRCEFFSKAVKSVGKKRP